MVNRASLIILNWANFPSNNRLYVGDYAVNFTLSSGRNHVRLSSERSKGLGAVLMQLLRVLTIYSKKADRKDIATSLERTLALSTNSLVSSLIEVVLGSSYHARISFASTNLAPTKGPNAPKGGKIDSITWNLLGNLSLEIVRMHIRFEDHASVCFDDYHTYDNGIWTELNRLRTVSQDLEVRWAC